MELYLNKFDNEKKLIKKQNNEINNKLESFNQSLQNLEKKINQIAKNNQSDNNNNNINIIEQNNNIFNKFSYDFNQKINDIKNNLTDLINKNNNLIIQKIREYFKNDNQNNNFNNSNSSLYNIDTKLTEIQKQNENNKNDNTKNFQTIFLKIDEIKNVNKKNNNSNNSIKEEISQKNDEIKKELSTKHELIIKKLDLINENVKNLHKSDDNKNKIFTDVLDSLNEFNVDNNNIGRKTIYETNNPFSIHNFGNNKKKKYNNAQLNIIQNTTMSYVNINKCDEILKIEIKNIGSNKLSKDCYIKGDGNNYFIGVNDLGKTINPGETFTKEVKIKCKEKNKENNQQIKIYLCDPEGNEITYVETSLNIKFDEEESFMVNNFDNESTQMFYNKYESSINLNDNLVNSLGFKNNLENLKENFPNKTEDYIKNLLINKNNNYDEALKFMLDQVLDN